MRANRIYHGYIEYLRSKSDDLDFIWLRPQEMNIIEGYKKKAWDENQNPFLVDTKDDKRMLARSILEHGMIFPFFSRHMNGQDWVILGSHRLKSLMMLDECRDMKFLCIRLPDSCFVEDSFATKGKLIKTLRAYPRLINDEAFENLGGAFMPFEGFNDIEYFKRWINVRQIQS